MRAGSDLDRRAPARQAPRSGVSFLLSVHPTPPPPSSSGKPRSGASRGSRFEQSGWRRIIFRPRRLPLPIRPVWRRFQKKIARDFRAMAENRWGIKGDFPPPPPDSLILRAMTRAHQGANWSGVPSLSHLWMAALLRLVAMLVSSAASFLRMRPSRLSGECHADATPQTLPRANSGTHNKETETAAANSQTTEALLLSRPRSGRPSKDEGGLTDPPNLSFSDKRSAFREPRFERQGDRRSKPRSPSSSNRESRDAAPCALPGNDLGCCCAFTSRPRL